MTDIWSHLDNRKAKARPPSEVDRILAMPRHQAREWDENTVRKSSGLDLRPIQRQALGAIADAKAGLFPIGVGHGKTYIALLAGAAMGAERVIVLTPPRTVEQVYQSLAKVDSHFRIPRTDVVAYSTLSRPDASDLLRRLIAGVDPSKVVLVADEAHNLKRLTSARTKRVARFLSESPGVRFVAMSGTLTAKSIKDFAHLSEWSLRDGSPVPRPGHPQGNAALEHWAACIDADGRGGVADYDWCKGLWEWAGHDAAKFPLGVAAQHRRDGLRDALHTRIQTTRGVVTTDQSSWGASLYLERVYPQVPAEIRTAMAEVERTKCRPDGEPLESPVDQWRILRQLSLGFWYRWVWPNGNPDRQWLDARAAWARHVRAQLDDHSGEGYDSPLLVYNRVSREHAAGQRMAIHRAWEAWTKVKDRPAPPVEAVWVSDRLLDAAIAPVLDSASPWIIWYSDDAVAGALERRGLEVIRPSKPVPKGGRTVCLSWRSHGTGLNLQAWAQNLVLSPSPSGLEWEQLIGRTHRPGQQEDEVWVSVLAHTPAFRDALANAKRDAEYLQHTTGQDQKLLLACLIDK